MLEPAGGARTLEATKANSDRHNSGNHEFGFEGCHASPVVKTIARNTTPFLVNCRSFSSGDVRNTAAGQRG